jgi:hypothetical protein
MRVADTGSNTLLRPVSADAEAGNRGEHHRFEHQQLARAALRNILKITFGFHTAERLCDQIFCDPLFFH